MQMRHILMDIAFFVGSPFRATSRAVVQNANNVRWRRSSADRRSLEPCAVRTAGSNGAEPGVTSQTPR